MNSTQKLITLGIKQRIPLEGLELEEYKREQAVKKLASSKSGPGKVDSDSDSDADSEGEDLIIDSKTGPVSIPGNDSGSGVGIPGLSSHVSGVLNAPGTGISTVGVGLPGPIKHDLMMPKGHNRVKGGGFFKQAKKSYPMFPAPEHKIKWDDYGEVINPEDYMISDHSVAQEGTGIGESEENKENKKGEDDPMGGDSLVSGITGADSEIPTKCITNVQTFYVNANIQFIDFEGRSDKESLKKIISLIKPRRLVLIHGSDDATNELANYCKSSLPTNKIFTPKIGEVVDATTESLIYQVKLKDSLVSSLNFVKAKDGTELAWVDAEIEMPEEESLLPQNSDSKSEIDKLSSLSSSEIDPSSQEIDKTSSETINGLSNHQSLPLPGREILPTLRPLSSCLVQPHANIFVNELKLSDFKQVLMNNGIQAEFHGGVLHCNNMVTVKRNESGRILIEGTLSEAYFQVRELLYQQYAII